MYILIIIYTLTATRKYCFGVNTKKPVFSHLPCTFDATFYSSAIAAKPNSEAPHPHGDVTPSYFPSCISVQRHRSPPSSQADRITNLGNLIAKMAREEPEPPTKQTTSAGNFWNDYRMSIGKDLSGLPQKSAYRIREEIDEMIYTELLSTS